MKNFILTLQFLTRIPINKEINVEEDSFAKGIVFFPLIGLIIGAFDLLAYFIGLQFSDGFFPIVCSLLANVMITGALHYDGLADTCDGIFSSRTRERMLEIMKDSRIGTNGAIAIVFDLLFRLAIMNSLKGNVLYGVLLLSPVAAKTSVIFLIHISSYARAEGGMGGLFIGKKLPIRAAIGMISGLVFIGAFFRFWGVAIFAVCLGIAILYRQFIYSKIHGMTGDTLGAANEVIELVFMLGAAILWRYGLL